ncbi:Metallo-dependent phosphatase-like protein [Rhypophila decipiens]
MIGNPRKAILHGSALAVFLGSVSASLDYSISAFTVPAAFPTTVYSTFYVKPGPTNEPQPVIFDPVLNITFPFSLTDPDIIPALKSDQVLYPPALANLSSAATQAIVSASLDQIHRIVESNHSGLSDNCSKCIAALSVGQLLARVAPESIPQVMVSLCTDTGLHSKEKCSDDWRAGVLGAPLAQVLAKADVAGLDGRYICNYLSKATCPRPTVVSRKVDFPKPRPSIPKKAVPSGKRAKVFHLSDLHLDTRYKVGSESEQPCPASVCCRVTAPSANGLAGEVKNPASLFGHFKCDSPFYLAVAALQSIGPLTGTSIHNPPELTLYTGDLVTHGLDKQKSRDFLEATEDAVWQMFKAYIGGPIYAALGNHDTSPSNLDAPHNLDRRGPLGQQFSWHYEHVSKLWEYYGSIGNKTQVQASTHYGAYSVVHNGTLRIITLNTDFYYRNNLYAFLNAQDPDYSGIFKFLIEELQKAEDAGQRAWIMGHAFTGWDGNTALPNGSDMLYKIIDRYSPHVIAAVFWGHTHEDQVLIYYTNNGTDQTQEKAINVGWAGPSITPLTNLNSGYRMYEVDTSSWEVYESYTFIANVSTFSSLQTTGPVFQLEYSTREAYSAAADWPSDAPLNATFWHRVTEAMERDRSLVSLFNTYQGKSSVKSPNCTSEACAKAKVCYIRSGSTALGSLCPQGFASVQNVYDGKNF